MCSSDSPGRCPSTLTSCSSWFSGAKILPNARLGTEELPALYYLSPSLWGMEGCDLLLLATMLGENCHPCCFFCTHGKFPSTLYLEGSYLVLMQQWRWEEWHLPPPKSWVVSEQLAQLPPSFQQMRKAILMVMVGRRVATHASAATEMGGWGLVSLSSAASSWLGLCH